MRRKNLFAVLFFTVGMSRSLAGTPDGTADGVPRPGMVLWRQEVESEAADLGLHFTVEADNRAGPPRTLAFKDRYVTPPAQKSATSAAIVAEIQRWFPDTNINADANDPKLLRIADKSLADQSKGVNPLDQRITLKFSGTLDGLLGNLPSRSFTKELTLAGEIGGERPLPWPVSVDVTNETCRQVLTDCIPSKQKTAVLWLATISTYEGKPVAIMSFYGATPPTAQAEGSNQKPAMHGALADPAAATRSSGTSDDPQPGMVPWRDVFEPLAFKQNIYVTIENDCRGASTPKLIFDRRYVTPPATQPTTRDALLQLVESWFPAADVTVADENPSLIHLSDSSLRDVTKGLNPLDASVTLQMEDHPGKLMQKMEELSNNTIALDGPTSKKMINDSDFEPIRRAKLTNQPYRVLLDEGVTTVNFQRILWEADILNLAGKPGVAVKVDGALDSLVPLARSDALNARLATQPATRRTARNTRPPLVIPSTQPAGTSDGVPLPGMSLWRDVATPIAASLNVYFYIENDLRDTTHPPVPFDSRYVTPPTQGIRVRTNLFTLINQAWFPGTSCPIDDRYPNVYGIQPGRPEETTHVGNPLDAPITLRFDGIMPDLMKYVEAASDGAIVLDPECARQVTTLNGGKPLHLFLLEQTYRDLFLHAVPLNDHFLWEANIKLINGKSVAVMEFFGDQATGAATRPAAR